jgi:hypothetical protein
MSEYYAAENEEEIYSISAMLKDMVRCGEKIMEEHYADSGDPAHAVQRDETTTGQISQIIFVA